MTKITEPVGNRAGTQTQGSCFRTPSERARVNLRPGSRLAQDWRHFCTQNLYLTLHSKHQNPQHSTSVTAHPSELT